MNNRLKTIYLYISAFVLIYVFIAYQWYWIKHPELSQMQVFQDIFNALLWKQK